MSTGRGCILLCRGIRRWHNTICNTELGAILSSTHFYKWTFLVIGKTAILCSPLCWNSALAKVEKFLLNRHKWTRSAWLKLVFANYNRVAILVCVLVGYISSDASKVVTDISTSKPNWVAKVVLRISRRSVECFFLDLAITFRPGCQNLIRTYSSRL